MDNLNKSKNLQLEEGSDDKVEVDEFRSIMKCRSGK
jgi:hypothetical protein